jgi:hypothetical protein
MTPVGFEITLTEHLKADYVDLLSMQDIQTDFSEYLRNFQ